ncbi:conserved domain protein [Actinomyces sp. oral taxon 175 str. F0384]|nr:conserved domain protein [Actinomyces sp. oral taxon 175 str. F0384]
MMLGVLLWCDDVNSDDMTCWALSRGNGAGVVLEVRGLSRLGVLSSACVLW